VHSTHQEVCAASLFPLVSQALKIGLNSTQHTSRGKDRCGELHIAIVLQLLVPAVCAPAASASTATKHDKLAAAWRCFRYWCA
jgi:hypothetical protein